MSTFPCTLEKSNFMQTCNRFSQFMKEKRSSGALSLGMGGTMDPRATSMDLVTNLQNSRQNASPVDFLPQFVEQSNLRSPAPETPQLTMFYAGKVLVFDAFPPEKATEIMELATKLSSDNSDNDKILHNVPFTAENLNVFKVKMPQTNTAQEASRAFGSNMRYPRRASLLKFLEKRKERVMARGPYQMNNPKHTSEDQSSKHFDLNL